MNDDELLELRIPPGSAFVSTARLFVAAAGRHFALSEEMVADVKVAVTEVCAEAIEGQESRRTLDHLRIAVRARPQCLEVEVSPALAEHPPEEPESLNGGPQPGREPSLAQSLRGPLVQALFPDAIYDPERAHLLLSVPWDA